MTVVKPTYQLLEYTLRNIFFKLASFSHIVEQIAASCNFNDKEDVLLGLKVLVETHDVLVASLLQNDHFLEYLATLRVFTKVLLVDALYRHHVLSQIMQGEVYLAEGAFTENLANSVKVYSGLRYLA